MYKERWVKVYYPTKAEIRYRRTVRIVRKVVSRVVVSVVLLSLGFIVGLVFDVLV